MTDYLFITQAGLIFSWLFHEEYL